MLGVQRVLRVPETLPEMPPAPSLLNDTRPVGFCPSVESCSVAEVGPLNANLLNVFRVAAKFVLPVYHLDVHYRSFVIVILLISRLDCLSELAGVWVCINVQRGMNVQSSL